MDNTDKKVLEAYQNIIREGKKKKLTTPEKHQLKIAIDTVKNPAKGMFLGGPSAKEAESILKKFGYSDKEIKKLKENLDPNERIQNIYESTIIEPMIDEKRSRVRGKKTPWRALKKRLKRLKGRFKRKKSKKTKEAFNSQYFNKKGKRIRDKFKKLLKRIMKEDAALDIEPRMLALAQHLGIKDKRDIPDEIEQNSWGGYDAEGGEYEVLTDDEADQRARDYIEESVWAFNTWFLENHIDVEDANRYFGFEDSYYDEDEEEEIEIGDADEVFYMGMGMDLTEYIEQEQQKAEGGNDTLASLVNASSGMDNFVDEAISADGRGHFLNTYDGEEHEEEVDGSWYYIYRTN